MTRERHVKVLRIIVDSNLRSPLAIENRVELAVRIRKTAKAIEQYAALFQLESAIETLSDWLFRISHRLSDLSLSAVEYTRSGMATRLLLSDSMVTEELTQILIELYNPPYGCDYREPTCI